MLQYQIPVDLGIERSIKSHQNCTTTMVNSCPHHETNTIERIMFQNTIGGPIFIMTKTILERSSAMDTKK